MRKLIKIKYALLLVGAAALFASCDGNDKKDDTNGGAVTLKAPTNLSIEKSSTEIKLKWVKGDDLAESYEIELSSNSDFSNAKEFTGDLKNYKNVDISEFVYGTTYYWRIRSLSSKEGYKASSWADSSFETAAKPNTDAYVGTWAKNPNEEITVQFSVGNFEGIPLSDFLSQWGGQADPDAIRVKLTKNPEDQFKLDTEIEGLSGYLPFDLPDDIQLTYGESGIVYYNHTIPTEDRPNYTYKEEFGEDGAGMKLTDLEWYDKILSDLDLEDIDGFDIEEVVVYSLSLTLSTVSLSGRVDGDNNEAVFNLTGTISGDLQTNINNPFIAFAIVAMLASQDIEMTIPCVKLP